MKFEKVNMRLVEIKEITTKTGTIMYFTKIADKSTFDSFEVALAKNQDMKIVEAGKDYNIVFETDGKYSSVTLVAKT